MEYGLFGKYRIGCLISVFDYYVIFCYMFIIYNLNALLNENNNPITLGFVFRGNALSWTINQFSVDLLITYKSYKAYVIKEKL